MIQKKDEYRTVLNSKFNKKTMQMINAAVNEARMDILFNVREQQDNNAEPHKYKIYMEMLHVAVRAGDVDDVIRQIDEYDEKILAFTENIELEECKRFVYAQAYHATYIAIEEGVPNIKVYSMLEAYLAFIRKADRIEQLMAILINVFVEFTDNIRRFNQNGKLSVEVIEAVNYIEVHMHDKIAVEEIAAHIHLSTRQLARKFQAQMQCTIIEYINEEKMEEARYLLRLSDLGVAQIASYLAFSSESYFIRVFKKYNDCSPSEFRHHKITG